MIIKQWLNVLMCIKSKLKKFIKDNKKIYYKIKYIKRYYCDR